jgi:hypothetical protein
MRDKGYAPGHTLRTLSALIGEVVKPQEDKEISATTSTNRILSQIDLP